ncbi:glutamate racemase [Sediminitomix flava]|uniref:Glutamate racemase n=1 Tax=Sediminitomix flava TaxID=379075 RepID=A0A315Z702_SEDFL|nr:glutamate racemase [Sediminitomix flava]PWJ39414.1 glutamate racemase [Sediminitomix flava]
MGIVEESTNPIGVFDSGLGGLSVWRVLQKSLPSENFIYVADSKHSPYGDKEEVEIIERSLAITDFLLSKNCKMIVVACNTATAAAIQTLRETYPTIPFIGMEPAIKLAATKTKNNSVGVLATAGTLKGKLYLETSQKYASHVHTNIQAGKGLVEIVEEGKIGTVECHELLKKYIQPMLDDKADQIVLGCTHYPFLSEEIQKITGPSVSLIDPAPAIAKQAERILNDSRLKTNNENPSITFYTNGNIDRLKALLNSIQKKPTEILSF